MTPKRPVRAEHLHPSYDQHGRPSDAYLRQALAFDELAREGVETGRDHLDAEAMDRLSSDRIERRF